MREDSHSGCPFCYKNKKESLKMKDYFEISVSINPNIIEIVTEVFFDRFECEGVVQAEEKYKDLELIETTNNIAKGYILYDEADFKPSEIQKIFDHLAAMEEEMHRKFLLKK